MLFAQALRPQAEANKAKDLNQQKKLLNLMCLNLVKLSGEKLDEAFYALATFLLGAERVIQGEDWLEQIENHFTDVLNTLAQGEIRQQLVDIRPDYNLQWSLLLRMQSWLGARKDKRAFSTLNHYVNKLIYIQAEGAKIDDDPAGQRLAETGYAVAR